jgi:rhodanese-related sulfurtransferase
MTADPAAFSKEVEEKYGKGKSFVVYGDRFGLLESYMAAKALEDRGLQALNYSGGLQEWYRAGLPVVGTDAVPELAAQP